MPRLLINDVNLHVETSGTGPGLLLLHGFTGSTTTWAPAEPWLASKYRTVAIDLLGHGRSDVPVNARRYSVEQTTLDLIGLLDAIGIRRVGILGYSLGGRLALSLAAKAPERVSALILESTSPGLRDVDARKARAEQDDRLAGTLEQDGLEPFVDRWETMPLFDSQRRLPATVRAAVRAQRLEHNPLGLANSLRGAGQGMQAPMHERLPHLRVPTLLIVGALDSAYCALGREMNRLIPTSKLVVVQNAGHAVHLEQPETFYRAVLEFLEQVQSTHIVR